MTRFLKEPLLHFLLLGGALFAIDGLVHGRTDERRLIVVGADVESEARELFEHEHGREPNEQELGAMTAVWLDNEVLYREGLAMQVDKGDDAIRERVIFKALSVIDANVKLPEASDTVLRSWFDAHRARYDVPARYDFEEAVKTGERSEADVQAFVAMLNKTAPGGAVAADLRVFKDRPHDSLVQSYGEAFVKALGEQADPQWRAVAAKDGWRAVRVQACKPAQPADFEAFRGVVLQDWRDATAAEQRTAAVRALTRKYSVRYEPNRPETSPE